MKICAITNFNQNYKVNNNQNNFSNVSQKADSFELSSSQISFNGSIDTIAKRREHIKDAKQCQKKAMSILKNSDRDKNAAVSESGFRTVIEAQATHYKDLADVHYQSAKKALEEVSSQIDFSETTGKFDFSDGAKGNYIVFEQDGKRGLTILKPNFGLDGDWYEPSVATLFDGKLIVTSRTKVGREQVFEYDSNGNIEKFTQKAGSISVEENLELTYVDGDIKTFDKKDKTDSHDMTRYVFEDGVIVKKYSDMYFQKDGTLVASDAFVFNNDEIKYSIGYHESVEGDTSAAEEFAFKKYCGGDYKLQEFKFRTSKEKGAQPSAKAIYYYDSGLVSAIARDVEAQKNKEATVGQYFIFAGTTPYIFDTNATMVGERIFPSDDMEYLESFHGFRDKFRTKIFEWFLKD